MESIKSSKTSVPVWIFRTQYLIVGPDPMDNCFHFSYLIDKSAISNYKKAILEYLKDIFDMLNARYVYPIPIF